MHTTGPLHHPTSELRAVRSTQPWAILATLAGALILAAIIGLKLDAVPELPAKIILGVSVPLFYGAALAAIRPSARPRPRRAAPIRVRRTGLLPRRMQTTCTVPRKTNACAPGGGRV